ncbi:hypothetical protein KIV56_17320 [Cryobacterium breve]|uniref:Uncharacterized protein n=1 Tax=Cryobacterium breve TaxID=1259258 RepID=A0ABY7NH98_9MICO|nr:hypothetical protein [Cryobacterium breve]WBM79903.1 hypothetical protein KIV56_17320 [Cryobacterium breve]
MFAAVRRLRGPELQGLLTQIKIAKQNVDTRVLIAKLTSDPAQISDLCRDPDFRVRFMASTNAFVSAEDMAAVLRLGTSMGVPKGPYADLKEVG